MHNTLERRFFFLFLILSSVAFIWILLPFFSAIFWAAVLTVVFYPVYRQCLKRTGNKRNLSAAASVSLCVLIAVVPMVILGSTLVNEAKSLYKEASADDFSLKEQVQELTQGSPTIKKGLNAVGITPQTLEKELKAWSEHAGKSVAKSGLSMGRSSLMLMVHLGIMIYLMFFLFRDGDKIIHQLQKTIPLSNAKENRLLDKLNVMVQATIKGNIIVAIVQGSLGGLFFWIVGIPNPALWTAAMIFASLIPAVGSGIVWLPVALYLLITGDILVGSTMFIYGVVIIGLADNILRPLLVGRDTRLPDYIILISTVGGLTLVGLDGFVLGPLIAGLFVVIWQMFSEEFDTEPKEHSNIDVSTDYNNV